MIPVIILGVFGLFCIVLAIICFCDRQVVGICPLAFGLIIICALVQVLASPSPVANATDKVTNYAEEKLFLLQDTNGHDCYVLRDSNGNYFYIAIIEDKYGKGIDVYKPILISSTNNIIVEAESDDVTEAYVDIDDIDARISAESLGLKPIKSYTFVVPTGTIKYARELPKITAE